MKSKLIALFLVLMATPGILAQCRGGQCYIQQPQKQNWYYVGQYPNGYYMILRDGQWVYQKNQYPDQDAEPVPTEKPIPKALQEQNFGVDKDKLSGEDAYTVHSQHGSCEISKQEAYKIVGDTLKDDSNKLRVTVIGDDGTQKKVLADINSLIKDINDWAIVRGYPPGHWALTPGFVQSGSPTVYCQTPSSNVALFANPELLQLLDLLRKVLAKYPDALAELDQLTVG
jgi:hypothetical protein